MNDWIKSRLGDCCEIVSGATPDTSVDAYWGGNICWATPKDLSELDSPVISDTPRKLTQAGLDACAASVLPAGSVLFSSRAPIGHVAINAVPMATNQGFKSFVPKPDRLYPKFLYWWLRRNRSFFENLGNGATFKEVSKAIVSSVELLLPPLEEQRRIAEILDRAEALRVKRRAGLARLETLTESLFLDLFASVEAKRWPLKTIADVASPVESSIRTGPFGSQLLHGEFVDDGVAVLGIDNAVHNEFRWGKPRFITEVKHRELKRYTVHPGDVLITIMGTCGRCAIVPDDIPLAINTKHLCCITLDTEKCLPTFLHAYFLLHPIARRYLDQTAKGAIMAGLNMAIIKEMPIPVPPLKLQEEFVHRSASVGRLKSAEKASLSQLDGFFCTLQYRAFAGEL